MQAPYTIVADGAELLDRVEPLWLELRNYHAALAPIWSEEILASSFETRRTELLSKASSGLLVLIATADGCDVGYCTGTIDNAVGEVQSIFTREGQRSQGIGRRMMSQTIEWFAARGVPSIGVSVIAGNDEATRFYANFGFSARSVRMIRTG